METENMTMAMAELKKSNVGKGAFTQIGYNAIELECGTIIRKNPSVSDKNKKQMEQFLIDSADDPEYN